MRNFLILSALAAAAASQAAIIVTLAPGKYVPDADGKVFVTGTVTNTGLYAARLQSELVDSADPLYDDLISPFTDEEPHDSALYQQGYLQQTIPAGGTFTGLLGYVFTVTPGTTLSGNLVTLDWNWYQPSPTTDGTFKNQVFVQTTPEPAPLAALGLGGLALLRRRRR